MTASIEGLARTQPKRSAIHAPPHLLLFLLFGAGVLSIPRFDSAKDQTKTEAYDDGKPHFVYMVDREGRKNGDYRELSPEGQVLVAAMYLNDQLNGPFKSLYPNGKPKIIAAYAVGTL